MFSIRSWAALGVIAVAAFATVPAVAPAAPIAPTVPAVAGCMLPLTLAQGEGRDNSASGLPALAPLSVGTENGEARVPPTPPRIPA